VNDPAALFLKNPELIRNLRIQMRPKRMAVAAAITGIVSLIILPALWPDAPRGVTSGGAWVILAQFFYSNPSPYWWAAGSRASNQSAVRRNRALSITSASHGSLPRTRHGKTPGAPSMAYSSDSA